MTAENFPVPQEVVEAGLLNSVSQSLENWMVLEEFTTDDFAVHKDIFIFMGQYLGQYQALPSTNVINSRFSWQPPIGDFNYWLYEFKRYSLARKVMEAVQEGYGLISTPDEALTRLLTKLSVLRSRQSNHMVATDAAALDRLNMFDNRTDLLFNNNEMMGIPTGIRVLDDTKIGWMPGSLIGAYSRPAIGKTWWLLERGAWAWMNGCTVLAITPEMPANMLSYRIDTVIANHLGRSLDYSKVLLGDPSVRAEYEFVTNVLAESQRWWTYDSLNDRAIGLSDITSLIHRHNPDILLVDGVSLMRYEGRGQGWEMMKDQCYGLKSIGTITEKPIIITHQATNLERGRHISEESTARSDTFLMPTLNDAAYGDAFVQACSDIFTFVGDQNSPFINWFAIKKHRERGWARPLPSRMATAIDFARGRMVDLSRLGHDPEAVGQEARRVLGM